jgi:hypothetical protein
MKRKLLLFLFSFSLIVTFAQPNTYLFSRYDSIPVTVNSALLRFPWAGGLNYSQFSNIDLNFDGANDLFIFDRTGNKVLTFVHTGLTGSAQFNYAPEYENSFPVMTNWALLVDYNCDGLPDIFTNTPGGMRIYKNTSTVSTGISFVMIESMLYSYYYSGMVNLYVSSVDLPAITDVDYDGDVDVITFSLVGARVEYHKNYSVENGFGCDSLLFQLKNECWGNFSESISNNTLALFDTCSTILTNTEMGEINNPPLYSGKNENMAYTFNANEGIRHSGSCILAFDNNGINSKDLLIGDISAKTLVYGENGGTAPNQASSIISEDTLFPSYDISVNLKTMACPFSVDVDNDGNNDLIVTPQSTAVSENAKGVHYYNNTATTTNPDFNFQTGNLFQVDMIERGEGALPVLFDYDGDGLEDLFVANYGFFNSATDNYTSKLGAFKNTGSLGSPSFDQVNDNYENLSATMSDNSLYPSFGDLDNDGDKDMLVGAYTGTLYYFENIAGAGNTADFVLSQANFTDYAAAVIDIGQYSTPLLTDLDRDGDNDLIIGERNGNLNYYENIGTASVHSFRLRTDTLGGISVNQVGYITGYSVPAIYDDGGKYQLIIGSQTGYIHHYDSIENNILGSYRQVDTTLLGYPHGIRSGVAVSDINNDGKMDIFTGNYRGGISFFEGDAQGTIGITELNEDNISIYPNPASDLVYIITNGLQNATIILSDPLGQELLKLKFSDQIQVDLSNFAHGMYFITIEKNNSLIVKKIIKQ